VPVGVQQRRPGRVARWQCAGQVGVEVGSAAQSSARSRVTAQASVGPARAAAVCWPSRAAAARAAPSHAWVSPPPPAVSAWVRLGRSAPTAGSSALSACCNPRSAPSPATGLVTASTSAAARAVLGAARSSAAARSRRALVTVSRAASTGRTCSAGSDHAAGGEVVVVRVAAALVSRAMSWA